MSVQDMIKKSVLESGMFSQYDIPKILAALAVALILGSVIYLVIRNFMLELFSPEVLQLHLWE